MLNIPTNAFWLQNGVTVAGGNGGGSATNQLCCPFGLIVDENGTIIIADRGNHRIVQWKKGDKNGKVVAGGESEGNRLDQLNSPTDVLIDKATDSLIICDWGNRRVIRCSRHSNTIEGEILIENIDCFGLAIDDQRNLYVSDYKNHEVRRYQIGEKNGTLVAGGGGRGTGFNQLDEPRFIFVDQQKTVYVLDRSNHRIMQWDKSATEGILIAGGQGLGDSLTQFHYPNGFFVDTSGTLYVVDTWNHRILHWPRGAKQGNVIVGGNGEGSAENQLRYPTGFSFDSHGNFYVADWYNHRVQQFSIE